jgi:NAD(P)-dependent dehydrogenase (short-subunit alcohol dehydrogenase family)
MTPSKDEAVRRRAALVTGGSTGIGLCIARVLGEEGYQVTLVARGKDRKLDDAVTQLRKLGIDAAAAAGDLQVEADVGQVVEAHRQRCGRLDVLVNSAGVLALGPVQQHSTTELDALIGVNLRAMVLMYRECFPLLTAAGVEHRTALVINLASLVGRHAEPFAGAYSATKFAVVGFTQAMRAELAPYGIRSCALCPGRVATASNAHLAAEQSLIPLTDVAEVVRLLLRLSPHARIPEICIEEAS